MASLDTNKVELNLGNGGNGTIRINGHDVPFVTSVQVNSQVGEANTVHLELVGMEIVVQLAEARLDAASFKQMQEVVDTFNAESDKAVMRIESAA